MTKRFHVSVGDEEAEYIEEKNISPSKLFQKAVQEQMEAEDWKST